MLIRTAPDPRFVHDGTDLWREETIPLTDAVLGTSRKIPTLGRPTAVIIPAGTQPDTIYACAEKVFHNLLDMAVAIF